jgi:hypothetical protein
VSPQEPLDGGPQERFSSFVVVTEVQDDCLEGPRGVGDEVIAGSFGDADGLGAELPGGAEVGVELPNGRQREAQGA